MLDFIYKSIQVVAEGSGLENYLSIIRNVAALRNLHAMFVREN